MIRAFQDSGEILLLALQEQPVSGRVLLVNADSELVTKTMAKTAKEVVEWSWNWSTRSPLAWPPAELFDAVFLRIPAVRELFDLACEVCASRLAPGGTLYVYGANGAGMKSIANHFEPWFESSEVMVYKHRERVVSAVRAATKRTPKAALKDWEKTFKVELNQTPVALVSYPGMFAHGTLDEGTKLLLEHLPSVSSITRVLDLGTGTGILARALRDQCSDCVIDAVDANAFAVEAAKKNVPGATIYWGDGWSALPKDAQYDVIVSNPPVHRGLIQTSDLLEAFIKDSAKRLKVDGSFTLVVQSTIPVKRLFHSAGMKVEMIAQNTVYQVWRGYRGDAALRLS